MKKIFSLIIATVFAATFANAQSGWVNHQGDNRISVKFPSVPREIIEGTFSAKDKDSTIYLFTIVDFVKTAGIDSTVVGPAEKTPEFATEMKTGYKQSLLDVNLDDFKIGTWRGFTLYTSSGIDSQKRKFDLFILFIGNKMYGLQTIRPYNNSDDGRDLFFNSISLSN
jgi:hypothetical protein